MSQIDLLLWFYERYKREPRRMYIIREVSKATGQQYSSTHKQVIKLWFFDWLVRKKQTKRNRGGKYLNELVAYRLNSNREIRVRDIWEDSLKTKNVDVSELNNTYLSSNNIGRKETKPIGRSL